MKYLIIVFDGSKPQIHTDSKDRPLIFSNIQQAEDEFKICQKPAYIVSLVKPIMSKHPKSIL